MGICSKLPTVASCCCGCTLRTGTLILAWIYVIGSVLALAGAATLFTRLDKNSTGEVMINLCEYVRKIKD